MKIEQLNFVAITVLLCLPGCVSDARSDLGLPYAVILDSGHGGLDHGAIVSNIMEDELNYDLACRIKVNLEEMGIATEMTCYDPDQGYGPRASISEKDTDEFLPGIKKDAYKNPGRARAARINALYQAFRNDGYAKNAILQISLHSDVVFNEKIRGAMCYLPGVKHCPGEESLRRRNASLSRSFATCLLQSLRDVGPEFTVHSTGDPIRSEIRASGGHAYVPAVLRLTKPPTRVLLENGNLGNHQDLIHLSSPEWRKNYAHTIAQAVLAYFQIQIQGETVEDSARVQSSSTCPSIL